MVRVKCGAGRIFGADLNGDKLRICGSVIKARVRVRIADLLEKVTMRICHVIKTEQWRSAPQIRPASHFVLSRHISIGY